MPRMRLPVSTCVKKFIVKFDLCGAVDLKIDFWLDFCYVIMIISNFEHF